MENLGIDKMMGQIDNGIKDLISNSSWRNVYWLARYLLNTDQYGGIGKEDAKLLLLTRQLEQFVAQEDLSPEVKICGCHQTIETCLLDAVRANTKKRLQIMAFVDKMKNELKTVDDIIVLIVTIKYVVLPMNSAMKSVPSNDREFALSMASALLDGMGPAGVGSVVSIWDRLGTTACLDIERGEVVEAFGALRRNLSAMKYSHTELDDNIILTAFVQEFERRLGQKRKSRAGGSLEDVASFLFDYYHIKAVERPDHFQSNIEVDKWFRCSDGWIIGISCKRTLRERWKQMSPASMQQAGIHKIKGIWHLITYDSDLSDEKLVMLGSQNQLFYLNDESERYRYCISHPVMKNYVKPLSSFIEDIYREQGKSFDLKGFDPVSVQSEERRG